MNHYKMIIYILLLIIITIQFIIIIFISLCKRNNYTRGLNYDIIHHEDYKTLLYKGKKESWIKAYDDQGRDMTQLILKYAGPYKNFYGIKTKIKDINRKTSFIEFEYQDCVRKFDKFIEF